MSFPLKQSAISVGAIPDLLSVRTGIVSPFLSDPSFRPYSVLCVLSFIRGRTGCAYYIYIYLKSDITTAALSKYRNCSMLMWQPLPLPRSPSFICIDTIAQNALCIFITLFLWNRENHLAGRKKERESESW